MGGLERNQWCNSAREHVSVQCMTMCQSAALNTWLRIQMSSVEGNTLLHSMRDE